MLHETKACRLLRQSQTTEQQNDSQSWNLKSQAEPHQAGKPVLMMTSLLMGVRTSLCYDFVVRLVILVPLATGHKLFCRPSSRNLTSIENICSFRLLAFVV